jgi:hypothetical protein
MEMAILKVSGLGSSLGARNGADLENKAKEEREEKSWAYKT